MFENLSWENLQKNLPENALATKKYEEDRRFWKLGRDENNRGSAIIRLLPDKKNVPYIKIFHHNFKKFDPAIEKDRWYIEDSPQTIGLPCPVSEMWTKLMKMNTEESKKQAELFKRKVKFITNILVIKDPANPENEGKVFLWQFGTKLNEKFLSKMNPSESDINLGVKPIELYHPLKGANIFLKIKKVNKWFDYDDTQILDPSQIVESEDEWGKLLDKTYELQEFLEPEHYTPYDELVIRLDKVLHGSKSKYISGAGNTSATDKVHEDKETEKVEPVKETPKPQTKEAKTVEDDEDLDKLLDELDQM